jgi:membrane-bound serine protease (ClpP class)
MKKIFVLILYFLFFSVNASEAKNNFVHIHINSGIGPATAEFIETSINYATKTNAKGIIIQLNTPGGLLESTRDIVKNILESKIPVIVYVAPGGSRAGSAGVFITLAANIAVMAPGTNIGAAHPVGLGGESDSSSVMNDKVVNDASAFIRTIAQKRNRNVGWAEMTVRHSISATENEALDSGAIDFICKDLQSLLDSINGAVVKTSQSKITLNTDSAYVEHIEPSWRIKLLALLSDPNIAYIFILLGMYGIFFELYNPGSIFPGVIGGISIIIGAYSLQMLPINYAGLALILLAVILFLIEIKVTSYGLLTIGGVISFFLGSVMLIDADYELEFLEISMSLIITATVLTTLFFVGIIALGLKAQKRKKATGKEGLIGELGISLEDISKGKKGQVRVHGEIWTAIAENDIEKDSDIEVLANESMKLKVKKIN